MNRALILSLFQDSALDRNNKETEQCLDVALPCKIKSQSHNNVRDNAKLVLE